MVAEDNSYLTGLSSRNLQSLIKHYTKLVILLSETVSASLRTDVIPIISCVRITRILFRVNICSQAECSLFKSNHLLAIMLNNIALTELCEIINFTPC